MRAGSGYSSRHDFAALRDELGAVSAKDHLLVVDACCYRFLSAKHTHFAPWLAELIWFAGWPATRWWRHSVLAILVLKTEPRK
jgi:hypothetical protein